MSTNNSFKLPVSRSIYKPLNYIKMSCDFYVYKKLRIYYNDEPFHSDIEISYECCKYTDNNQEKRILLMKPIIMYINNSYTSVSLENKYSKIIEEKINNDMRTFNNVTKIIKYEQRIEK
jgi:hypothetical protein